MNTEHIPKEILDNPNINLSGNNIKDINYLNDTFKELKLSGECDKNNEEYKQLIIDINARIDAEFESVLSLKIRKLKALELREAKEKLAPALNEPNIPKMMGAPVTAIVASK